MTAIEMSNEFDVLYNNINSPSALGLTEYEKSVFLTRAQNEIIEDYFSPTGNKFGEGFDRTPTRRHVDFNNIIQVDDIEMHSTNASYTPNTPVADYEHAFYYAMPEKSMMVLNELLVERVVTPKLGVTVYASSEPSSVDPKFSHSNIPKLSNSTYDVSYTTGYSVYPLKYETYKMLIAKPFALPAKNQAWRLYVNSGDGTKYAVVIKKINGGETTRVNNNEKLLFVSYIDPIYKVRYIRRPLPIITVNLSGSDVSIDGKTSITDCELDTAIHLDIVQRAVELAKGAMAGDLNTLLALGSESQTALGPGLVKKQN